MSNKFVKISIVLIFMLFVMGLFNFCFAYEFNEDNYDVKYSFNVGSYTYRIGLYDIEFDRLTKDNSTGHNTSFSNFKVSNIDSYSKIYGTHFSLDTLYCIVLPADNSGNNFTSLHNINGVLSCGSDKSSYYIYEYDFDTEMWTYKTYTTSLFIQVGTTSYPLRNFISFDNEVKIYNDNTTDNLLFSSDDFVDTTSSIEFNINQTGSKTGYVEFIPKNWDDSMYYIKDSMDELVRIIAEEEITKKHDRVKYYSGPVSIETDEYVLGLLFNEDGSLCFSEISDTIEIDYDFILDDSHCLRLEQDDLDTYYLFIHSPQDGDYIKVSSVPITASDFNTEAKIINGSMYYNGLSIRDSFINGFNQLTREINIDKNTVNYFYLYDVDDNLIDSAVLNTSDFYDGSDFDFDIDLSYGSSASSINPVLASDDIFWVKVLPTITLTNLENYELYFRIVDYGNIPYINEEYRKIYVSKDSQIEEHISYDTYNSNIEFYRIDEEFNNYFYICSYDEVTFTFELQLRSVFGQTLQTKTFTVTLSGSSKTNGTNSSQTDGKDDTYIRDSNELSGTISNSSDFDFSGLNDLSETDLKANVESLIDNSIGFFGLFSTIFLLLPTWVSSLLYLFLFGVIVITLLRFIRGA